ncbi:MAG: ABC transporter permease [Bacteroidales bacterium]|nr:ABC transporter permease [Bacteroidales bacterium]MBN2763867.1 ABC transporter permease [Bacteroidales bacterium]
MKTHNLKLVLRTLYRNKLFTFLNVLGLSIGMASAMLIFLWIQFQVSFDRFHENAGSTYRVIQDQFYTNGEVFHVQVTPTGLSGILKENVGSITHSTRYNSQKALLQVSDTKAIEEIQLVDPEFFKIFSFPLLKGNPEKVLENPHSMVISEKMAEKYFGEKDAVGENIILEGQYPFTITGIIKDCPKNTEIKYNFLIPFVFYKELGLNVEDLGNNWIFTFVQLLPGTSADSVNKTIEAFKKKNYPQAEAVFFLQPLKRMHLYAIWGGGPIKNVRLFSIIAVLIILVAAINFTNLSTAMAARRFKEIGIKKAFGANRKILLRQFFSETILLSFISLFVALVLAESFLPWYNSLLQTELRISYTDWKLVSGFLGIMVVTGILSGAYPAFFLSSFRPVQILKGPELTQKRSILRETLVVLQFCLAVFLMVNTIIIKKQQNFMQKQELGIKKENILYIPIRGDMKTKYELFKSKLENDVSIQSITLSSHLPTGVWSNGGGYKWQGKPPEVDPLVSNTAVDFDYARTFGIKMHEGNFYSANLYNDTSHIVINKTFADIIGLQPITGQIIEMWGRKLTITGVTKDFNFKPLFSKIEPLVMFCWPGHYNYMFFKISTDDISKTIKKIGELHNSINGSFPFEYHFLDEDYGNLYESEKRQGKIFNAFSVMAVLISCLGLFGLSSFMMAQRTKEIGIRKTNGATAVNIISLLSRYYLRWVFVSFIIAIPVSYWFIHAWLKNYAYRTTISWWIFVLAGALAFFIALATVAWQSLKAAKQNPVEALRYE